MAFLTERNIPGGVFFFTATPLNVRLDVNPLEIETLLRLWNMRPVRNPSLKEQRRV